MATSICRYQAFDKYMWQEVAHEMSERHEVKLIFLLDVFFFLLFFSQIHKSYSQSFAVNLKEKMIFPHIFFFDKRKNNLSQLYFDLAVMLVCDCRRKITTTTTATTLITMHVQNSKV